MFIIEQRNITLSDSNTSFIQNKYVKLNDWFAKAKIKGRLNISVEYNVNSEEFSVRIRFDGGKLNSFIISKDKDFYDAVSKAFRKISASLKTKKYKAISKKRNTQFENSKKKFSVANEESVDDSLSEEDLLK